MKPSGRKPAPGVGDDDSSSETPFQGMDPSVVGAILGFALVSAVAAKVMGG